MKYILQRPDTFGAFGSALCILHCLGTPFLFISHSCSIGNCEAAPFWWQNLDFIFLTISFFAIYFSIKTTSKNSIKYSLWSGWTVLFVLIMNEKMQWFSISEIFSHITAVTLAALHLYNLNYCQCKTGKCCLKNE